MNKPLQNLLIPTYKILEADLLPHFELFYPYTRIDNHNNKTEVVKYEAAIIENEYLKVTVIPSLGARIYDVFDKVNNSHIFHYNETIRTYSGALRGAWISSGMEFNLLHKPEHTQDNFSPVDWKVEYREDGTSIIYIGNLNLITNVFWLAEIILRPERQFLEIKIRNFNNDYLPNKYYFWTNTAESVTPATRIFIPGRHTPSGNFPIDNKVDVSWYKNCKWSVDAFIIDCEEDFFGCYDYNFNRGVVQYANHFKVTGKKRFTWGTGEDGLLWVPIFSDNGLPYIELQSGRFRTQGIIEFIKPHFLDKWQEFWYPIAKIGGITFANKDATLYLDIKPNKKVYDISAGIYVTKKFPGSKIKIRLGNNVVEECTDLSPKKPYVKTLVSKGRNNGIELLDSKGNKVISWDSSKEYKTAIDPSVAWSNPVDFTDSTRWKKLNTAEEIWVDAVKEEKIGKRYIAELKYKFALKIDKEFSKALTSLGTLCFRQGRYKEAAKFLEKAAKRNLCWEESHYYLGLCYFNLHNDFQAEIEFWKARNSSDFFSPSSYYLSILNIKKAKNDEAEEILLEGIKKNPEDLRILTLYATILRRQGRIGEALKFLETALEISPLYYRALFERSMCLKKTNKFDKTDSEFRRIVLANDEKVLETAKDYLPVGFFEEAIKILEMGISNQRNSPLIYYYLGFAYEKLGDTIRRDKYYKIGNSQSCDYVFPHRLEDIDILQSVKAETTSPNLNYYLGNLYFGLGRFNDAISEWEMARQKKMQYSVLYRNLGYAYYHLRRSKNARDMYKMAARLDPTNYRLYSEYYDVVTVLGTTKEIVNTLESATNKSRKDVLLAKLSAMYVEIGKYEESLKILKNNTFTPSEGYYGYWEIYGEANVRRGVELIKTNNHDEALGYFQQALIYLARLGVGAPYISNRHEAMQKFWLGKCYALIGDKNKAEKIWKSIFTQKNFTQYEIYYKGLVLKNLGKIKEANVLFKNLLKQSFLQEKGLLDIKKEIPGQHFLLADYDQKLASVYCNKMVAYMGLGEKRKVTGEFKKALRITKNLGHYKWLYNNWIQKNYVAE